MILNLGSLAFNANMANGGGTPTWGTELGQGEGYRFHFEDAEVFLTSMLYTSIEDIDQIICPLGKGGGRRDDYEFVIASVYEKIYVNGLHVPNSKFVLLIVKQIRGEHHIGRRSLKYNPRISYRGVNYNEECYHKIPSVLGISNDAAWFVDEIYTNNQDELHFVAYVLNANGEKVYQTNEERKQHFISKIKAEQEINKTIRKVLEDRWTNVGPLQQIFYGAPGTGKSHKVNEKIQNTPNALVFRTTFHPDSDYSTFIGAYKPTMKHVKNYVKLNMSLDDLAKELNTLYNDESLGNIGGLQKFCYDYHMYLDGEYMSVNHGELVKRAKIAESYKFEIPKYLKFYKLFPKQDDSKIIYSFVPQAFLKAYVAAWQNPEQPVFLVIEEINRGNCAQIFGDIFQLLDRKDGVSEYPIKADQDIRDYLAKEFAGYDLEANILSGEELVLPANLHIWATMNTSDQSLFPIDSAFKRRWDWKYMPIHDAGENWTIALSDVEYDWWDFVEKINNVIGNMTSSEDKKLGYFFCKACNGKIDAETFVNKVVFYLWNDVFKDYELSDKAFQDGEGKLTFNKFYTPLGDANEATIKTLMENMGVELKEIDHEPESEEDENELEDSTSPAVTLRKQKCKEFWTDFLQYAQNNSTYMSIFSGRKTPTTDHWYTYNVFGRPLTYLCVDQFRRRNELVVSISMDKPSFAKLAELYKNEIEQKLQGMDLTWVQDLQKSTTKSNIREVLHVTNFEDPIERQQLFIHIVDRLIRMYGVFNEYFGKISE